MMNHVIEQLEEDFNVHIYDNLEPIGVRATLPSMFELQCHNPRSQKRSLWCVGMSGSAMRYCWDLVEFGEAELLSVHYIMKYAKESDGFPINDGTTLSAVCQVLKNKGVCTESLLPSLIDIDEECNKFKPITSSMINDASKRKVNSYAKISTLNSLKDAIVNNNGALFAIRLFRDPHDKYGFMNKPNGNHQSKHCMFACGYDDNYEHVIKGTKYKGFIKLFDWYEDGSWGYKWFPYAYFNESAFRIEMMCCYDDKLKQPNYHEKHFDGKVIDLYKDTIIMTLNSDIAVVNGVDKKLNSVPKLINNVTMVPIRNCSEFFRGCYVTFDNSTKIITIADQEKGKSYFMKLNDKKVRNSANEVIYTMLEPPTLIDGSTYLPIRAFGDIMGATIEFNSTTKVITIIR